MLLRRGFLAAGLAMATLLGLAPEAMAQRDAGSKMRGEFGTGFYAGRSAGRKMRSVRSYSQGVYEYATRAPKMATVVTESDSELIGQTLQSTKRDVSTMRKEHAADKEILARLDEIDKHLAAALEQHKKMHEECCKDEPNADMTMVCCNDLMKELDKAIAEHAALMRKLYLDKTDKAEKPAADKKKAEK